MGKILVVEDNPLNKKLFCDVLENKGHQVVATSEGNLVLDLVRQEHPNLIVMDVNLPHISGIELIHILKQSQEMRHIPVIAVTAFAMKDEMDALRDSGCDDMMTKPISVAEFCTKVGQYLGGRK
ncbi:MAG: response regulator [Candidatus Symbiobacter sp.]|nr:response regulator [Candidatus Symbiobacter sp.]